MLKRIAIFIWLASVCLADDSSRSSDSEFMRQWKKEQARHKKLASEPTPNEWRSGAVWRFVTTPPRGKPKPEVLIFRVTDQPGVSCLHDVDWKNVWRKFVVLEGHVPFGPPIYQVEGRALQINLSGDMCDAYDTIDGVLTGSNFTGQRTTSGLGASTEIVGTVSGSFVRQ